jgi:RNA recognition motif-containing protein
MGSKLYVGNLSYSTDSAALEALFTQHGRVVSVHVATDRDTGRARGFAFVEMESESAANAAMAALNGSEMDGRQLKVDVAQERGRPNQGQGGNRRY